MLSLSEKHLLSIYSVPESAASQGTESEQPPPQTVQIQSQTRILLPWAGSLWAQVQGGDR